MAGEYLPPVVLQIKADISDLTAKMAAARSEMSAFKDDMAAQSDASKAESMGGGPGGGAGGLGSRSTLFAGKSGYLSEDADKALHTFDSRLQQLRHSLTGPLESGLQDLQNNLQGVTGALQGAAGGVGNLMGSIAGAIGGAGGAISGGWGGITSAFSSITGFVSKWVIMLPTVMALPALLGAIGGAAGGAAASFTVLASAIAIFAAGAMEDLSRVSSVSTMAQFDALSGPLQSLYYALHNFENMWTELTQTVGQTTITDTLTQMLNTGTSLLQRFSPILGQIASAGSAAFGQLDQSLNSSQFTTFVNWIGSNATPVLVTFTQTFTNVAQGWAGLMEALTPAMTLFDNGMVKLTSGFANFASTHESQIQGFIQYVQNSWTQVSKFWSGLGHILFEFFSSASKGAPAMAADLGKVFDTIGNALPHIIPFAEQYLPSLVLGFANFGAAIIPLLGPVSTLVGGLLILSTSFLSGLFGGSGTPTVKNMSKLLKELGKDARDSAAGFHRMGEDIGHLVGQISKALGPIGNFISLIYNHAPSLSGLINDVKGGAATVTNPGNFAYAVPRGQIGAGASYSLGSTSGKTPSGQIGAGSLSDQGTKNIRVESHHNIQVSGPISTDGLAQIDKLLTAHDQQLARILNMTR